MRLNPFDYTEKNIVTIKKEQEAIDAEIARVKALPHNSRFLTSRLDEINELFVNHPVTKALKTTKGLGKVGLQNYVDACEDAKPGEAPEVDYYINDPNPYRAKY